ncbi:glycolipid transfer protein HET-C2, partial [Colletotrichum tofieldiae]
MASQSYTLDHLKNNLGVVSANIHYGNAIRTAEFLAVFDSLIAVFDTIGNDMLEGGRNDMAQNIQVGIKPRSATGNNRVLYVADVDHLLLQKLRDRAGGSLDDSHCLQNFILAERAAGQQEATEALLWLTRGIEFFVAAMKRTLQTPTEKLAESILSGYKDTLKKHHGFIAKTAIKVGVPRVCPSRDEFS